MSSVGDVLRELMRAEEALWRAAEIIDKNAIMLVKEGIDAIAIRDGLLRAVLTLREAYHALLALSSRRGA